MKPKYSVKLKDIVKEQELTVVHASKDFSEARIYTADVNRPALQLTGFYNYFDPKRIQAMGRVESTYLESLSDSKRLHALEEFMRFDIAALIICHGMQPFAECVAMAEKYDRNLFMTQEDTSTFMADLISSLRSSLAPRTTCHGVLVEVHGEGLLITGDSGIGKSETALELIKRGHRLIADDTVEIRRVSRDTIVGTAPELIRYYMELRGIGVIDVRHIYGIGSVKPETNIDMVVNFELWNDEKAYDRLGLNTEYCELLGVKVPCVTIPVRQGRNLAVILELAAMNNRQKNMGYNAAQTLADKHDEIIDQAEKE
ncbi:MAG TPA: HPr(Ser) kinase/phosphatase [Clostridiales bacterium]|nr:HPr(Ser) kinase/phosphatase [Clostridiales bacterium]